MIGKSDIQTISQSARILLTCGDNFALMKQAVDDMYQVFSAITGVTIQQLNQDKDIMLPSGKAIGMAGAAHCLLEMKRTAVFLRGIHNAIALKLSANNCPIHILYAGTGPFGTLITPLLLLYNPEEIKVDLLDINQDSLTALQKIIDVLEIGKYIGEIYCTDATTMKLNHPYDIVVSETMQACLKNEPQVAVMQNLIPQLNDQCIFIPEEISIDACFTNLRMEMDRMMSSSENVPPPFERRPLGNVFTIKRDDVSTIMSGKRKVIPCDVAAFPVLKLFTTVKVFGDEVLTENNSSLNLPKPFYDFRKHPANEIEFLYVTGEKPGIEINLF